MYHPDAQAHVLGTSVYLDDIPLQQGTLFAVVLGAPIASGLLNHIDTTAARQVAGVLRIITAADIPGENQIGGIIPDEPLLADKEIHYQGQALGIILANSVAAARKARKLIRLELSEHTPVLDLTEAREKGLFLSAPRTFRIGNTTEAWANCTYIAKGLAITGGQEHLYLETQAAYAFPEEGKKIKIYASTQGLSSVQRTAARVLGLPMQQIQVETIRLGGGFGGKEDQATPWACMAALAAQLLQKPVKLVLHRADDMRMTGKRNPYRATYTIGLDENLRLLAYEVNYLQNGGAAADLSPAILERTLFHATNAYFIPNVTATAYSCKTNTLPNTAFRGFGGPQAMFVMEAAILQVARENQLDVSRIQAINLLKENDEFPYGQVAKDVYARACWEKAMQAFHYDARVHSVQQFNAQHPWHKKGLALMPVCFGISFTNTMMNQAGALVHIYQDGSIAVNTAAVEMGQGVNTKMAMVAARCLSVSTDRIRVEFTNTTRVANTSPTAASTGSDLNGKALSIACAQLLNRLLQVAGRHLQLPPEELSIREETVYHHQAPTSLQWEALVAEAFQQRTDLSAHGHYATPGIYFDKSLEKGHPFAYHAYGVALAEVSLDCLRGTYTIDAVDIVHDYGESLHPLIDRGQVEGGLLQGIGWMTCEEIAYDAKGRLLAGTLSAYKAPDLHAAPRRVNIISAGLPGPDTAIFHAKAVGEPPLMYGIGIFFALQNAIMAFNPAHSAAVLQAPLTPEAVLMALYGRSA
jgi:xanthine dehydrogenase large subunit